MLNNRYIKSIKRDIFVLISFPVVLFQFLFCYILERKDKKSFKRAIIVLISFLILFVSISFLVNIGKEMSLPGFRTKPLPHLSLHLNLLVSKNIPNNCKVGRELILSCWLISWDLNPRSLVQGK